MSCPRCEPRPKGEPIVSCDTKPLGDRRVRAGLTRGLVGGILLCAGLTIVGLDSHARDLAEEDARPAVGAADSLARIDADFERERARIDRERIDRLKRL